MTVSMSVAAELKKTAAEKFSAKIHFHDGCGGQYFTVDKASDELKGFIAESFAAKNMRAVFSEDGCSFTDRETGSKNVQTG